MSLEEKAREAMRKLFEIQRVSSEIEELCRLVILHKKVDDLDIELSSDVKQKIMQAYQAKKEKLKTLLNELP